MEKTKSYNINDYICPNCGYIHATKMANHHVPPVSCYRCQYKF